MLGGGDPIEPKLDRLCGHRTGVRALAVAQDDSMPLAVRSAGSLNPNL